MEPSNSIVGRIYKALLYIDKNLNKKLSLELVAKEAYFSPYHFHRLFSAVVGEKLNAYILRKRIERAMVLLLRNDDMLIVEIAEKVGFDSGSSFSRSFKKFYGMSPSKLKKKDIDRFSKICIDESKDGQDRIKFKKYISNINNHLNFIQMKATIEIKTLSTVKTAYIGHIGNPEKIANAFNKLIQWAFPKGLMSENTRMGTVYHDSPKVTEAEKLRMSACVFLEKEVEVNGEVGLRVIPGGKHVVARYEIGGSEFQKAWESVFVWLSEKGFKPHGEPFEIYYNDYNTHPEKKFIVDICVPVE
ncbi:transcriptional regulator, AraC family [Tenacibaculum sp. MAR_2009_124]|uniref:AraC family transcriptional regulator n=1 Tax=Tenacibaculum sp. MAR_2009_124 TaxID=1250059 RepID=UPI00089BE87A|nr:AraC family transcriptional regulator [Tenacibaculum sp. MAR_2009_124]SEC89221.1 transcriptional regulator, AraC family [Tenacibaculum sp. MAR_2009_124]